MEVYFYIVCRYGRYSSSFGVEVGEVNSEVEGDVIKKNIVFKFWSLYFILVDMGSYGVLGVIRFDLFLERLVWE